jgi:hypothetical protein
VLVSSRWEIANGSLTGVSPAPALIRWFFEDAIGQVAHVPFQNVLWLAVRVGGVGKILDHLSWPVSMVRTHVDDMHRTKTKSF